MRPPFQIAISVMLFLGAGVGVYAGTTGILDGAVAFPTQRGGFDVLRSESSATFWGCVAFWYAAAIGFFVMAVVNVREALRRA